MTPTETEVPTFTPTATVTPEEVIEVLLENIPVVEVPQLTIEDMPIESDEIYSPEDMEEFKEWDITLMDGFEDEPPYEEPLSEPLIETPTEELPTIESEEEKKK
jgi:hypothetical protein